jgi:hypothetical protein
MSSCSLGPALHGQRCRASTSGTRPRSGDSLESGPCTVASLASSTKPANGRPAAGGLQTRKRNPGPAGSYLALPRLRLVLYVDQQPALAALVPILPLLQRQLRRQLRPRLPRRKLQRQPQPQQQPQPRLQTPPSLAPRPRSLRSFLARHPFSLLRSPAGSLLGYCFPPS